ncbi:hypothetical protein BC828DRAFT_216223 [Blastocladiella britannica]|nr:hypothetical protein BC828DRAFT_216223 [Blastocladiella britannica]
MTSTNNNTSTSGPVLALTCADTMAGFYVARGALAAKAMAAAAKKPTTKPSSSESSTSPTTIVPGTNWSKVVAIVASRAHPYAVQLARAGAEIRELAAAADGGGGNEDEVLAGIDAVVLVPVPTWAMVEKTRAVVDAIGRSESVRAVVLASCITAEMATTNGAAVAATAAGSEIGTPTAASSSPSGSSSSNNKPTTHPSIPLMYADVEAMVAKLVRTPVRVCIARVGVPNQLYVYYQSSLFFCTYPLVLTTQNDS